MGEETSFGINIVAPGDSAETAADAVARLATQLTSANTATKETTAAVKSAEAAYNAAATTASRAASAVEKIGVSLDAQRAKMKAALDAGDPRGFWRAAQAIENLNERQTEAVGKANAANDALAAAALKVDGLRAAATAAAEAEKALAKSIDERKAAAAAADKAAEATARNHALARQQNLELAKAFLARQKAGVDAAQKESDAMKRNADLARQQNADIMKSFLAKSKASIDASKKEQAKKEELARSKAGTGNLGKAGNELAGLGGPVGALAQKVLGVADSFGDLKEAMGSGGVYAAIAVGITAIVAGVVALTAAAAAGIAKITAWAVSLADAARTQRLFADGVAGSVAGGAELDATLNRLANRSVPQTRDELLSMAGDLAKTGLKGKELSKALEEAAVKAAIVKFGPDFKKEMNSLPQQAARLQANFSNIFGGLKIEKLLEGMSRLVALFDTTSITGRAIKVLFESLFQPLIDGVVAWIPKMEAAFIRFEILVFKAMLAIKPYGSTLMMVAQIIGVVLVAAMVGLALIVGVVIAGVTAMAVGAATLAALLVGLVAGVLYLGQVFASFGSTVVTGVIDALTAVWNFLTGFSLAELGTQLIDGLVTGITGGAGKIIAAMTGAVGGAINAAKSLLGIASPSKVFAEIGQQTGAGMAVGVDASTTDVQGSLEAMVAPPSPASLAAAPSGSSSSGKGGLAGFTGDIIFNGVKDGEDAIDRLLALIEGDLTQLGGAEPDAP